MPADMYILLGGGGAKSRRDINAVEQGRPWSKIKQFNKDKINVFIIQDEDVPGIVGKLYLYHAQLPEAPAKLQSWHINTEKGSQQLYYANKVGKKKYSYLF